MSETLELVRFTVDPQRREEFLSLRGPLLRYVRRPGAEPSQAEGVVQEALIDIVRGIGGYRWQASFLSWAYAVASRRAAREGRRSPARAARLPARRCARRVGAQLCACSPAAFRQRVSRARREMHAVIRAALDEEGAAERPGPAHPAARAELHRLVQLGELHRACGRTASPERTMRAALVAAPTLLA
jgi:hypothetical protein